MTLVKKLSVLEKGMMFEPIGTANLAVPRCANLAHLNFLPTTPVILI